MKIKILLINLFIFTSCRSYLDDNITSHNANNEILKFAQVETGIEISYINKMRLVAHNENYYQQHFRTVVPKKIRSWIISSPTVHLEYDNGQLVIIDADYKSQKEVYPWTAVKDDTKLRSYVYNYFRRKNRNWNSDEDFDSDRVYKHYSDGKSNIILFNVQKTNADEFEKIIGSFSYIN